MEYLWTKDVEIPEFQPLKGNLTTDVLIIGGGMAGILCARMLHDAKVNYALVEADRIGSGMTRGTTAVLTAQHDTLYADLIDKHGEAHARQHLEANLHALANFRALAHDISCDLEDAPSIMYSLDNRAQMEREVRAVNSLGFPAELTSRVPLPFGVAGAVVFPGMAQFHPLKFLAGLVKDLHIHEHTFVRRLEGTVAYTDTSEIRAKRVIVATHFPFVNRHGLYFMKLYQKRSFVIALRNAPQLNCTIMDVAENGMYLRNYEDLLLVGGGDRRTGKQSGGIEVVRAFARRLFPQASEVLAWANQDCISLDGVPYIGSYSPAMPDVYVATGFNEWGMTSSMVAAEILTDMVRGQENRYADAFAPNRSMLTAQLFANMGATLLDFAIPTVKRCSHLGCALRWNPAEHSWDCPCHGSRFSEHGRLLNNPAMRDSHVE